MKIIDLYNLLANKKYDELPRKIKVRNIIYDFHKDEDFINYKPKNGDWLLNQFLWKLNEEIEIIEEKEIEKLDDFTISVGRVDDSNIEEYIQKLFEQQCEMFNKINEIINKLKKNK